MALLRGGSVLSKETHLRNYTVGDGVLAPLCVYAPTNTRTLNSQCSGLPTYSRSAEEPSEVEVEVKLRAMLHRISEIVTIFLLVPVGSQVSRNEAKNLTFQKLSWHQLEVYYYCTYLPLRYTVKLYNLSNHFKDAESVARATTDALISDHFLPLFFFLIRSSNEHDDNIMGDFLLGDEGHSFDNHDSGVILLRGRVEEAVGILLVGDGPACSSQSLAQGGHLGKVVYYVVIPASLIV